MMTEENIVEHETDSSLMNGEMENSLSIPSLSKKMNDEYFE